MSRKNISLQIIMYIIKMKDILIIFSFSSLKVLLSCRIMLFLQKKNRVTLLYRKIFILKIVEIDKALFLCLFYNVNVGLKIDQKAFSETFGIPKLHEVASRHVKSRHFRVQVTDKHTNVESII